jgi:plastocyanin
VRRALLGAALAAGAFGAVPAAAGAATVDIGGLDDAAGFRFSPPDITAQPGDTIQWGFAAAAFQHNVNLVAPGVDPANLAAHELIGTSTPHQAQPFTKVLDAPGIYLYYCSFHGLLAPGAMNGRIVVGAVDAPPPAPTGPPPQPNPFVFSGPFEVGDFTPPGLRKVGALAARRTVLVRYQLSEPGTLRVRLLRGRKAVRAAAFKGRPAGVGTVRVKGVKPGRFTVAVSATDRSGLSSAVASRKVRVAG